jgi:hypothetical protein
MTTWHKIMIAAAFVLVSCALAAQNSDEEIRTRFGIVGFDDNGQLRFRGHLVQPGIQTSRTLDLSGVYRLADRDVVMVTAIDGIACPYRYYFVSVNKEGAKVSDEVGTCAKADDIQSDRHSVTMIMQGFLGPFEPEEKRRKAFKEKHSIVFRNGVVTDNGNVVK